MLTRLLKYDFLWSSQMRNCKFNAPGTVHMLGSPMRPLLQGMGVIATEAKGCPFIGSIDFKLSRFFLQKQSCFNASLKFSLTIPQGVVTLPSELILLTDEKCRENPFGL